MSIPDGWAASAPSLTEPLHRTISTPRDLVAFGGLPLVPRHQRFERIEADVRTTITFAASPRFEDRSVEATAVSIRQCSGRKLDITGVNLPDDELIEELRKSFLTTADDIIEAIRSQERGGERTSPDALMFTQLLYVHDQLGVDGVVDVFEVSRSYAFRLVKKVHPLRDLVNYVEPGGEGDYFLPLNPSDLTLP